MPFFDPPPPKPRRRQRVRVKDEKWAAPQLQLPGRLPGDLLLAAGRDQAVVVSSIACYPTGFGFDLRAIGRYYRDWHGDDGAERMASWPYDQEGGLPDDLLRFGVEYSHGGKATTLDEGIQMLRESRRGGKGPHLHMGGGGGGGSTWRWEMWVTPLPPEGPVTFVCEWPAVGIEETRRTIPAARIRKAAERARPIF